MGVSVASAASFPSRRDAWVVRVFSVSAALEAIAAVALLTMVLPSMLGPGRPHGDLAVPAVLVSGLLLGAGAIVVAWFLFGTSYNVTASELVIRSGPLRWRVPIARIASVEPTNRIDAAPALSLSRLQLRCANPEKDFLVSPDDPAAFVAALKQINPSITVVNGAPNRS